MSVATKFSALERARAVSYLTRACYSSVRSESRFREASDSMNIATFRSTPPRFLMCPPQHFAVTYSINPWMDPAAWADRGDALHASAEAQWQGLHARLSESGAAIEMVLP